MLEFKTKKNIYAWDNDKGLFVPFTPTMQSVAAEISICDSMSKEAIIERLDGKFDSEDIEYCFDWLKKWERVQIPKPKSHRMKDISAEESRNFILSHCLSQLTLCITEDCNFRCKYCSYSDFYEFNRGYSDKYMDFRVAKKAIDYFFSLLDEGKRFNPIRKPSVGFFGGEPLLNFEIIKEIVEYIEEKYNKYNVTYAITTNGSLLDEEKGNWLMDHEFILFVSLDGPEEEHDIHRVYRNGTGTFKDVLRNVIQITARGYKEIYCLPVFDWKCDFFKREDFFNRKDIPPVARLALVNNVGGCKYYEQFTDEDRIKFSNRLERARSYYFGNPNYKKMMDRPSFLDQLVGFEPGDDIFKHVSLYLPPPIMPFTGACIPGRKLFVDVHGKYHICERVNESFPIGDIDEGLNFEKIVDIIVNYMHSMDKCPDCKVSRKCTQCYQDFMTIDGFSLSSKVCERVESVQKSSFVRSFEIAEADPEFIEGQNYKYKNLKKFW